MAIPALVKGAPIIVLGLIGIGFLIGFHELGHFLFCKLFNIKTPSFSIGFGPQIFKKKIGETLFSLSAIPLGGYVEIAGIEEIGQGEQKEAKRRDERAFSTKPYYQKLLVLSGGIIFNLLFAYFAMILLFMVGMPKTPFMYPEAVPATVRQVVSGSAAESAQLSEGDVITGINQATINSFIDLRKAVQKYQGKKITIHYTRNGKEHTTSTQLPLDKPELGIAFAIPTNVGYLAPMGLVQACKQGIAGTNKMLVSLASGFAAIFSQRQFNGLGGPVMIIKEIAQGAKKGFGIYLLQLILISINLAILNLVPIPILDGGQILFVTLEAIFRRPIPEKIRLAIHLACWVSFILLAVYLTYRDILRIFGLSGIAKLFGK